MKTIAQPAVITPAIIGFAVLFAAVTFIGVTGKRVPLLSNIRLDIILPVIIGIMFAVAFRLTRNIFILYPVFQPMGHWTP